LAQVLKERNKLAEAIKVQENLVNDLASPRDELFYETILNLARMYRQAQDTRKARKVLNAIVPEILRKKDLDDDSARGAVRELADVLFLQSHYARARELYELLLPAAIKFDGADSEEALGLRANMAAAYAFLGQLAKAQEYAEKAFADAGAKLGADNRVTLDAGERLAGILRERGEYNKAMQLLENSITRRAKALGPENSATLSAQAELGKLYNEMGDYATARTIFLESLALAERTVGPEHPITTGILTGLGSGYSNQEQDDFEKAAEYIDRVLAVDLKKEPAGMNTLNTRMNHASLFVNRKKYDEAAKLYQPLLKDMEKALGKEHPLTLELRLNIAILAMERGNAAEARKQLEDLLPLINAFGGDMLKLLAANNLRKAYNLEKNLQMAEFYGRQAVAVAQKMREGVKNLPASVRQALSKDRTPAYQGLADVLMAQSRVAEAQAVMGLLKEEELGDIAQTAPAKSAGADIFAGMDPALVKKYQDLSDKLVALGKEEKDLKERREAQDALESKDEARLKKVTTDLDAARKAVSAFMNALSAELAKKGKSATVSSTASAEKYQKLLKELGAGAVLIQTVLSDDRLWLILTTPDAVIAKQSPADAKTMSAKTLSFRNILQDPEQDAKPMGKEFYDAIIAPLAPSLEQADARTIMFALDGSLRYIPMAALYDGAQWLAQKYALSMFNEAAGTSMSAPTSGERKVAGLGVTKEHKYGRGKFTALPAVKGELTTIVKTGDNPAGIVPGMMALDEGFVDKTLQNVLQQKYPIVHMASHFHFNPKNPGQSFLLLGDGSGLNLERIATSDEFKFNSVELLALSACQTARGGTDANGKEVEGFGALAQKRGARAVLATLWPVFDESTGLLMSRIYALRKDDAKMSLAETLRQAQLQLIENKVSGKNFTHPFYWAPFVLMGDWR
jgi:CHAT domain-containing protein